MELHNLETVTVHLQGYNFTHGIEYDFTKADSIQANGYLVLAKNSATYPGSVQWTSNGLRNSGERIVIINQAGLIVDSLSYDDAAPWPAAPNGGGPGTGETQSTPEVFALHQNYPNPFNPATSIRYDIPKISDVRIEIYNLLGQRVKALVASRHQPGFYRVQWNGRDDSGELMTTGLYICRILARNPASDKTTFTKTQKLLLIN